MPVDRRTVLKHAAAGLALLLPACRPKPPPSQKQDVRGEGALRFEFRHTLAGDERFLLTRLRAETAWGGPSRAPASAPDWGDYRFELTESGGGQLLYRAGFDSSAARDSAAALSVRAPHPTALVDASIARRRPNALFQVLWTATVDPADRAIDRSASKLSARVDALQEGPAAKVDIAIVGDGYREAEHAKFIADARRAADYLFSVEPYRKRMNDFNVRAVFTASEESGVSDPYLGLRRATAFGCSYGTGAAERTLSVGNESALREVASAVPSDCLLVLANARRYGGSAYFGGPAVVSVDSAAARYLVLHEFGHAFAGLAEEYYIPEAAGPAYAGNIEPWNPNVTLSPASGKWSAPQARDWNKSEYDRYFADYVRRYLALRESRAGEDRVERFMHAESRRQAALLAKNPPGAGYFEGANGYARGVFRSEVDCVMFSLQTERFCAACTAAIDRAIDYHTS